MEINQQVSMRLRPRARNSMRVSTNEGLEAQDFKNILARVPADDSSMGYDCKKPNLSSPRTFGCALDKKRHGGKKRWNW